MAERQANGRPGTDKGRGAGMRPGSGSPRGPGQGAVLVPYPVGWGGLLPFRIPLQKGCSGPSLLPHLCQPLLLLAFLPILPPTNFRGF